MTTEELDLAIEELETRLERLRALYEQYFLGFEKVEPAVARKDVDRRIYVLRREKIRNTGKRFKLQTLIQRYNTFQQYWQRVCREIENGTYRRLLQRVGRKVGPDELLTIATQRRFGRRLRGEPGAGDSAPPDRAPPPSDAPDALTLRPARPEATSSAPPRTRPASNPADANSGVAASGFTPEEAGTGAHGRRLAPPPKPVRRPTTDDAPPGPSPLPPRPEPVPSPVPPPRREMVAPRPAATPPAPRPRTQRPSAFDSLRLDMDFLGDWDPGSLRPKAQPAGPAPAPKPSPEAKPAAPADNQPPPAPARAPVPKPKSSPRAAPAPKPEPPAREVPRRSGEAFDARVRELHEKLNELKRQNREGSQVSLEGLAKSLRDTEAKLREKHGSRRIDFEVVLKDGRAVVKPIVR